MVLGLLPSLCMAFILLYSFLLSLFLVLPILSLFLLYMLIVWLCVIPWVCFPACVLCQIHVFVSRVVTSCVILLVLHLVCVVFSFTSPLFHLILFTCFFPSCTVFPISPTSLLCCPSSSSVVFCLCFLFPVRLCVVCVWWKLSVLKLCLSSCLESCFTALYDNNSLSIESGCRNRTHLPQEHSWGPTVVFGHWWSSSFAFQDL